MASVEDAVATFERNIEAQTGRSVAAWSDVIAAQGLTKHGQIVAWLKTDHGLSHGHANHIAKKALAVPVGEGEDPVAPLFAGKEALQPLYDAVVAAARGFGEDVEVAPKKANVSLRRKKQFALLQPSTKTRLDLGLILPDVAPNGRLEASGSFNAMFTHRVRLESIADLDAEVLARLKAAYDRAG